MHYFKIEEFLKTSTNLPNVPNDEQRKNIETLVEKVLDPAREILQMPIIITSGFRSKEVNKKVGGVSTSQHLTGCAADIRCADMNKLWGILKELPHDQLIDEFNLSWIHVSFVDKNRHEELKATKDKKGKTIYTKIV